jgi:hypothetical protein
MGAIKWCVLSIILSAAIVGVAPAAMATGTVGWLPVPPEDLALKDNPKQPGADAMILYREVVVSAKNVVEGGDTSEEYVRIKIFTQEGTKEGHVEIPFTKDVETLSYVNGRTIQPDGTVVNFDGQVLETTAVKTSGLKVLVKAFTLPDVKPGASSSIDTSYKGNLILLLPTANGSLRGPSILAKRISPTFLLEAN